MRIGSTAPRHTASSLLVILLFLLSSHALMPAAPQPSTTERLQALVRAMTFDWAKAHPMFATFVGLSDEDGRLNTPSLEENERDLAMIRGWERELAAIPLQGVSLVDTDDAKLLRAQ